MSLLLRGAGYRYPSGEEVGPVDLVVGPGERVLLTGPSGGGKSTVARLAAGLLQRHGRGAATGEVRVAGVDPAAAAPSDRAALVGFVSQEPGDQLVAGSAAEEVAFALDAAGWAPDRVAARVAEVLSALGLADLAGRDPRTLSGGQQQRLVVAAALAAAPGLLVLDEPLAMLDPEGAAALLTLLRALPCGVLLVEHRVEVAVPWADRVIRMDAGRIFDDRPARELDLAALVAELRPHVPRPRAPIGEEVLAATDLRWRWGLGGVDVSLRRGERVALVGPNGAGKSTLLAALAGDLDAGPVRREGRVLLVPQDPDLSLFCATVRDEIAYGPTEDGATGVAETVSRVAAALDVTDLLDRPPQALSKGQRLRVAIGAAVACRPAVLLLDEPTAGQDLARVEATLGAVRPEGALLFATHDLGLADRQATRTVEMRRGRLDGDGAPEVTGADVTGGLDPRTRLLLLLAAGALAILLDRPLALGLLCLACAVPFLRLALDRRWRALGLGVAAAVVWSTVLSQGLFYADEPRVALLRLGPVTIWREGVLHGLAQSLRLVSVGLGGVALAVSTAPDRLFAALVALRVPYALAFLSVTALRFVPVAAGEWAAVRAARARRGRALIARSPWRWLETEMALLRPLVARALRRARTLAESLDARGFDPFAAPALRNRLVMPIPERVALAVVWGLVAAVAAIDLAYAAYLAEVWYAPAWRPLYAFARAWL